MICNHLFLHYNWKPVARQYNDCTCNIWLPGGIFAGCHVVRIWSLSLCSTGNWLKPCWGIKCARSSYFRISLFNKVLNLISLSVCCDYFSEINIEFDLLFIGTSLFTSECVVPHWTHHYISPIFLRLSITCGVGHSWAHWWHRRESCWSSARCIRLYLIWLTHQYMRVGSFWWEMSWCGVRFSIRTFASCCRPHTHTYFSYVSGMQDIFSMFGRVSRVEKACSVLRQKMGDTATPVTLSQTHSRTPNELSFWTRQLTCSGKSGCSKNHTHEHNPETNDISNKYLTT